MMFAPRCRYVDELFQGQNTTESTNEFIPERNLTNVTLAVRALAGQVI